MGFKGQLLSLALVAASSACRSGGDFTVMMADSSMEPTYTAHAVVQFQPTAEVRRGEVIAFEYPFRYPGSPHRVLIARLIGLPGDRIELRPEGVWVNGERLREPYAKNEATVSSIETTVPAGSFYVLGDDRNNQRDSRWWGALPATRLLGVARQI